MGSGRARARPAPVSHTCQKSPFFPDGRPDRRRPSCRPPPPLIPRLLTPNWPGSVPLQSGSITDANSSVRADSQTGSFPPHISRGQRRPLLPPNLPVIGLRKPSDVGREGRNPRRPPRRSTTTSSLAPPPRPLLLLSLVSRPVWRSLPPPAAQDKHSSPDIIYRRGFTCVWKCDFDPKQEKKKKDQC